MKLFNPVKVYVEYECVAAHSAEIRELGSRALIVTGRSSSRNGSLSDVCSVLDAGNIPYAVFDRVEENPSVETCMKAAETGIAFGADFIIGIGGGSPLDAAKAVCVLAANPDQTEECMYAKIEGLGCLPLACVPTTCGTGSEVTPNGVLTYHRWKTKKSMPYTVFPRLALVDGKYLAGAPESLLVNTSIDALSHLTESYLSSKADSINRMYSSYGLQQWGILKDTFFASMHGNENDLVITAAMAQHMMLTSTAGGLAISQTGTSLPHAMSYSLTYEKGIAHGIACGVFLASYMRQYEKHNPSDIEDVCFLLGFECIDEFDSWIRERTGTVSVTREEFERYARDMAGNSGKLNTFPFLLDPEEIRTIYRESLIIE